MEPENKINVDSLLGKPLWQLTAKEFVALSQYAYAHSCIESTSPNIVRVTGVRALAEFLDCCESTVYMLRRNGVLNEAIISQVGKRIVFDAEKARELAESFQQEQRAIRKHND